MTSRQLTELLHDVAGPSPLLICAYYSDNPNHCGTPVQRMKVYQSVFDFLPKIKADRPLTRDTLNAPWLLTDNSNGLVMVIRNYHWLNSASRVLISTCSAPLVQTEEQFFTVWPWPLTYDPDLQSQASQTQGRPSYQKSRSKVNRFKQESAHRQTAGHTHGRYQTYYLPW